MTKAKKAVPKGYHTVTPVLTFDNTRKAIDWYKRALGATELAQTLHPNGKVLHAEIQIGESRVMLQDAIADAKTPTMLGGSPARMWVYVRDCDALFRQALAAGATETMPMSNQFWGDRSGMLDDPFGYSWWISSHKEDLTTEEMELRRADFFKQTSGRLPGTAAA